MRHGSEAGSVVLGGRKVPVRRPRVRTADGRAEVPVPAYSAFASADLLEQMALERMLPQKLRVLVERRMRDAYHADSVLNAEAKHSALAAELDKKHPGAAASLREGMVETLTIPHLQVPPTLSRSLRSTNPIESMIGICRDHATNVKNWRDGQMALRWCAAGMNEAAKQFRRVNGHLHLPKLRAALERHVATAAKAAGANRSAA